MQPSMTQPLVEEEQGDDVMHNFPSRPVRELSVFHIAFGIICFVCQLMAIANEDKFSYIASGIWGGLLMAVAGGVGIVSSKRKTTRWIYSFLAFLIATSVSTFFIMLYSSLSISYRDSNDWNDVTTTRNCVRKRCPDGAYPMPCVYSRVPECEIRLGMNCLLLIVAVAELVISIWASVLCCSNTCCSKPPPENELPDFFPQAPPSYPGQEGQSHQFQPMNVSSLMHTRGGATGNPYTALRGQRRMIPKYIGGPALPSYEQATSQTQPVPSYGQAMAGTQRVSHSNQASAEIPNVLNNNWAIAEASYVLSNIQATAEASHVLNNAQATAWAPHVLNNAHATSEASHVLNNTQATAWTPHVLNNAQATAGASHVLNNTQATAEAPHVQISARGTSSAQPIPNRMQVPNSGQASAEATLFLSSNQDNDNDVPNIDQLTVEDLHVCGGDDDEDQCISICAISADETRHGLNSNQAPSTDQPVQGRIHATGEAQRVTTNDQCSVEAESVKKDAPDTAVAQRVRKSDPPNAEALQVTHDDLATAEDRSVLHRDLATVDPLQDPDLGSSCLSIGVHPLRTSDHTDSKLHPNA